MAEAYKVVEVEQLASSTSTVYTAPTSTKSQITFCVAVNPSASNRTISMTVTPSGGSAATYIETRTIPAGKADFLPELLGMGLDAGDSIEVWASASSAINLKLRILEST